MPAVISHLLNRAVRYELAGVPVPVDILTKLDDEGYVLEALPGDLEVLARGYRQ